MDDKVPWIEHAIQKTLTLAGALAANGDANALIVIGRNNLLVERAAQLIFKLMARELIQKEGPDFSDFCELVMQVKDLAKED